MADDSVAVSPSIDAMVVRMRREVTRHNPLVQRISARMGWRAETLVAHLNEVLPSPIEQHLYLRVARGAAMKPESMAKILRLYLGSVELRPTDLIPKPAGENLALNRFDDVGEYLENVLTLWKRTASDLKYYLNIRTVAELVRLYGDHAEAILDSIETNFPEIKAKLDPNRQHGGIFPLAVRIVLRHAYDRGGTSVLNVLDLFDEINYSPEDIDRMLREEDRDE